MNDEIIISDTNQQKIDILIKVINQLISGKFFNSKEFPNYSPFNSFFIEIMPKFLTFFDKLVDINLPEFIKNVLVFNDEDDENNSNNNEKIIRKKRHRDGN